MNSREKKLCALLVVVSVYAVGDFGYSYLSKKLGSSASANDNPVALAQAAVSSAQMRLAATPLKETDQYILRHAEKNLTVDPMKNLALGKGPGAVSLPAMGCSGYIVLKDKVLVVLNGREYALGDTVKLSGEVVEAFENATVVLRQKTTGQVRRIAVKKDTTVSVIGQ